MIMPGRAVKIVTVTSLSERSIAIFEIPALPRRAFKYLRILSSSTSFLEKSLPPYQLESHPLMIPNLRPIGFVFCPIVNSN